MRRAMVVTAVVVVILSLMVPALAKGPAKAGGKNQEYFDMDGDGIGDVLGFYIPNADMYIGQDYGVGSTATLCSDGTWVDVIPNAILHDKGHYVSEWPEPYSEEDWVTYKFWLSSPVLVIYPDGEEYTATNHIFFKVRHNPQEIILQSCK